MYEEELAKKRHDCAFQHVHLLTFFLIFWLVRKVGQFLMPHTGIHRTTICSYILQIRKEKK